MFGLRPVFLVSVVFAVTRAARVLFLCEEVKSHQGNFAVLAEGLAEKGHEVHWLFRENSPVPKTFKGERKHILRYHKGNMNFEMEDFYNFLTLSAIENPGDLTRIFEKITSLVPELARTVLLKNEDIMQTLEKVGFDAAIVDGISLTKYLFLIPHRLNIPIVTLSDGLEPWHARVSWLPSFCPLNVLPLTDNMNFFERLQNFFFYIYLHRTGIAPPLPTD
ncbi:hypothetical protein CAPTEDRAFT_197980, partial [Capitella teleta]